MADRTISYLFRGDFRNLTAGLTAAGRSVQEFGGRLSALDRDGDRMRRGLTTIGDGAGKMGLVAAAGFGVIIAATARFDKAMSAVQAATGESADGMEKLRAAAIKAGADTVFSATEAADGITELGKAGLSTADILSGGLAGALDLAAAGQISVASAAETTATVLTQFNLSGDQASRVADTLAASAGKALGSVDDMSEALKYVGPVASQMGLSLEDTSGAIAELASQGILGSQAGTSLRGMLTSLTSPSKQASLTMEGLGISMYDAQGKFIGLDGVAGQLKTTMGGLDDAQRDEALGRIFGNEQITAARILYAGGAEAVQDWTDKVTDSGFAAQQAAQLTDNLAGDLEQLKGSLETALIGAGEGQTGMLRGLTQKATEAVNVFNDLPGPIKTTTTGLLALVAVTGGAAFFGAKVISGIAATNVALAELGVTARLTATSLATAGASIGALAVVSAGYGSDALGMTDSWNRSREASDAYGDSIAQVTDNLQKSNVGKYAADLGVDLIKLAADLAANGENGAYVSEVMDRLSESGHGAGAMFSAFGSNVLPFYTSESEKASAASQDLREVIEGTGLTTDVAKSALTLFAASATDVDAATRGATEALGAVKGPAIQTAEEVTAAAKALEDARKAAQSTAEGFFNLGNSLNDSNLSLDGWITDLQNQANALANFRHNAEEAADKGLRKGLIQALKDAGPEGAMRLRELANATDAQIGRANRAWKRGQAQIQAYVDETAQVPAVVATNLVVRDEGAYSKIAAVKAELASIDRNIEVYVNIRRPNAGGLGPQIGSADGSTVPKDGRPYADRYPYMLAPGEEVISNRHGQADRNRPLLKAINAGYLADGGTAKGSRSPRGTYVLPESIDTDGGLKAATRAVKRELAGLERQVKRSEAAVDRQSAAFDASKDVVDRETSARDDLISKFDSLSASIQGQFQSDLFGPAGNAFASNGPTNDPISVLMADIANSQQFGSLFSGLQGRGLSGSALQAGAAGGLTGLQTLSAYSDTQLAQFQTLFDQREQMGAAVGQQVAQAQYGQAINDQNLLLQQANALNEQQAQLLAQAVAALGAVKSEQKQTTQASQAISSSAAKGQRSKSRSRK